MSSLSRDADELSDDELLERIAALDEERYPVAVDARRALDQEEGSS